VKVLKCALLCIVSLFICAGILYAQETKISGPPGPEVKAGDGAVQEKPAEAKAPEKPPEDKVTGTASVTVLNRYIFRGYQIGKSGLVIQPSLSASYKGFSATYWGNIDTNQRNTTSAVFADEGHKGFNEADLTLSYTYTVEKFSLTGGYIYYDLRYANSTEEFFVTLAYDMLTKPTFSMYQDINAYPGTYMNLSFAHSFSLPKDITVDLGASFGYEAGQGRYWQTFQPATGDYTGSKYKGFHDGMVKAGLTIPVTKAFLVQPLVQYYFPLSGDSNRTYGINPATGLRIPYNPNGYLTSNWVYGVNFAFNF
jgi:hypothetical protein